MGEASLETSPKDNMIQDMINSDNMNRFVVFWATDGGIHIESGKDSAHAMAVLAGSLLMALSEIFFSIYNFPLSESLKMALGHLAYIIFDIWDAN